MQAQKTNFNSLGRRTMEESQQQQQTPQGQQQQQSSPQQTQQTVAPSNGTTSNGAGNENGSASTANASSTTATSNSQQTQQPLVFPAADVKHFVGGFHSEVTEENLRQHFSKYGAVADVKIMRDSASGRSRGFGFVTMVEPSSKARILAEKEHVIGGRKASVRPYTEQADLKDSFTDGPILKRKIFVGGVNPALGHDALENYFGKYGPLEDATIMRYPDGRSRGFGFVVFRDEATCQQVLQQRNHYVTPRDKVEVKPCLSRGKSRPTGVGGTIPEPHYGGVGYSMSHLHPYSSGSGGYGYGAGGGYAGGSYGAMYGSGHYGGAYGAGSYGGAMPGAAAWSDYRDGGGGGWGPYDSYGSYYGGSWPTTGGYVAGGGMTPGPQQQGPYGPASGLPRSAGLGTAASQPPQSAGGRGATDVGYYDLGPSAGTSTAAAGGANSVSPMATAGLASSASAAGHPGYGPMRRGTGGLPPATATGVSSVGYGAMARGRAAPY